MLVLNVKKKPKYAYFFKLNIKHKVYNVYRKRDHVSFRYQFKGQKMF